jgi:hypothetical protein
MAEGGLDQVNGGAAIERVGGVGMAKPMWGNRDLDPGPSGGLPHDAEDGKRLEAAAMLLFAGPEDRIAGLGLRRPQRYEEFPD